MKEVSITCTITDLLIKHFPDIVERITVKLSKGLTSPNSSFIDNRLTVTGYKN